ncbi:MAG: DUF5667 domain-containing protein [Patescibacteria group bacterium]
MKKYFFVLIGFFLFPVVCFAQTPREVDIDPGVGVPESALVSDMTIESASFDGSRIVVRVKNEGTAAFHSTGTPMARAEILDDAGNSLGFGSAPWGVHTQTVNVNEIKNVYIPISFMSSDPPQEVRSRVRGVEAEILLPLRLNDNPENNAWRTPGVPVPDGPPLPDVVVEQARFNIFESIVGIKNQGHATLQAPGMVVEVTYFDRDGYRLGSNNQSVSPILRVNQAESFRVPFSVCCTDEDRRSIRERIAGVAVAISGISAEREEDNGNNTWRTPGIPILDDPTPSPDDDPTPRPDIVIEHAQYNARSTFAVTMKNQGYGTLSVGAGRMTVDISLLDEGGNSVKHQTGVVPEYASTILAGQSISFSVPGLSFFNREEENRILEQYRGVAVTLHVPDDEHENEENNTWRTPGIPLPVQPTTTVEQVPASSLETAENISASVDEAAAFDDATTSPRILPGNPLYVLKDGYRGLALLFTRDREKKIERRADYANEKIREAYALWKNNKKEDALLHSARYQEDMEKIAALLAEERDAAGGVPDALAKKIVLESVRHHIFLGVLSYEAPGTIAEEIVNDAQESAAKAAAEAAQILSADEVAEAIQIAATGEQPVVQLKTAEAVASVWESAGVTSKHAPVFFDEENRILEKLDETIQEKINGMPDGTPVRELFPEILQQLGELVEEMDERDEAMAQEQQEQEAQLEAACTADEYSCRDWSACTPIDSRTEGTQTRECYLVYDCPSVETEAPVQFQYCAVPMNCAADEWTCGEWNGCVYTGPGSDQGLRTRLCRQTVDCPGIDTPPPSSSEACTTRERCALDQWNCNWSDCAWVGPGERDGLQRITECYKVFDCPDADTQSQERVGTVRACTLSQPQPIEPSCTEDQYSCRDWNVCSPNGTQTRECYMVFDCAGAATPMPETSRACEPPPSCTADQWNCNWSSCTWVGPGTEEGRQEVTQCYIVYDCPVADTPAPQSVGDTRTCTASRPQEPSPKPACTSADWQCTPWSTCADDGTQIRSCSLPDTCTDPGLSRPATSQSCTPTCKTYMWTCGEWSSCTPNSGDPNNGTQTRSCTKTIQCQGGVVPPTESRWCQPPVTHANSINLTINSAGDSFLSTYDIAKGGTIFISNYHNVPHTVVFSFGTSATVQNAQMNVPVTAPGTPGTYTYYLDNNSGATTAFRVWDQ